MKKLMTLMVVAGLALAGAAHADTTLQKFVGPVDGTKYAKCAGDSYNADGTIAGACATSTSQPCSGRACQPVVTTISYNVLWDAQANALSAIACASTRHHLPQADQVTYLNGFAPGDCRGLAFKSPTVVMIDYGIGPVPFYLIAVAPSGLTEIVADGGYSYLVTF